jgi:PAS domain S-box-containing protein
MDYLKLILGLSIVLQFLAAGFALTLIPITRHRTAWILISIALILMGTRRLIGMFGLLDGLDDYILIMELVAVVISVLMVLGVIRIKEHFQSLNRISHQKEHLNQIIENTSDFVCSMEENGYISYLNPSARKLLGVPADGSGDPSAIAGIFPTASLDTIRSVALPEARQHKAWRGKTRLRSVDGGNEVDVSQVIIAHPPSSANGPASYSTIARDITESVRLEERLAELSNSRERLLGVIAHDLRGPIGNSLSLIRLMRDQITSSTPEEIRGDLLQIETSLSRNHSLMEDLLQWTRGQGGWEAIKAESLSLPLLATELLNDLCDSLNAKDLNLENHLAEDLLVRADLNIIRTILRNLLVNAVKFTPPGGNLSLSFRTKDGMVHFHIADSGPGIPEEVRDKIGKGIPVSAVPGSAGERGNGLGLSLCQALMEKMRASLPGSALRIKQTGPTGTTMELILPKG